MEKVFDPYLKNFGFTKEDIFPLLETADVEKIELVQYTENEFTEIETRTFFTNKFPARSNSGKYVCFKFLLEVDVHVRKDETITFSHFWVDLDD